MIAFSLAVVAGFAWLVKTAAGDDRAEYSLGVSPSSVAGKVPPGQRICEEPIDLPVRAAAVIVPVATDGRTGQPLVVTVQTASGQVLGRGRVAGGYAGGTPQTARLDRVVGPVDGSAVCIANRGRRAVPLYGSENVQFSHTVVGGKRNPVDLDLRFVYDNPRSFAAELPDAFERAALFRPGWVGAWLYWVLLALLALGAPLLLGWGLWRAAGDEEGEADAASARHPLAARTPPPLETPAGDRLQ